MLYVTPSTLSLPRGMEQKPLSFLFCRHCGLRGATKRCSRCAESYYCNTICQQEDWIYHKNVCGTKGTHGTCEGCHFNIPGIGLYASERHFPCQVCLVCYTREWEPQVQTMKMNMIIKRTGTYSRWDCPCVSRSEVIYTLANLDDTEPLEAQQYGLMKEWYRITDAEVRAIMNVLSGLGVRLLRSRGMTEYPTCCEYCAIPCKEDGSDHEMVIIPCETCRPLHYCSIDCADKDQEFHVRRCASAMCIKGSEDE